MLIWRLISKIHFFYALLGYSVQTGSSKDFDHVDNTQVVCQGQYAKKELLQFPIRLCCMNILTIFLF